MDTATRENMDKLVSIGEQLLKKKVARVDLTTGVYQFDEEDHARTNDEEIERFARSLVNERNLRLQNKKKDNNINNNKTMAQDGTSTREYIGKPNPCAKKEMAQQEEAKIIHKLCFPFWGSRRRCA